MALDKDMPILIVDDYKTMVRIIKNLLKQIGFKDVDDAADGTDARVGSTDVTAQCYRVELSLVSYVTHGW